MTETNPTADNRSMATDAVATIGMLIPENSGRDAIHLAVEPVVAGERLHPGQHIGFLPDGTVGAAASELLGIVDPFLKATVFPGEAFWLVVYPRTITSLRHVWAHPAFATAEISLPAAPVSDKAAAHAWIEEFAKDLDLTVSQVMRGASLWAATSPGSEWGGEYTHDNSESYKNMPSERFEEFWRQYEIATEAQLADGVKRESFFTCSC